VGEVTLKDKRFSYVEQLMTRCEFAVFFSLQHPDA